MKGPRILAISIIFVGFLIPLALYRFLLAGSVPTVTPEEARAILISDKRAVLVDLRTVEAFAPGHLEGAVNWPYNNVAEYRRGDPLPTPLVGRKLLMLCPGGGLSVMATRQLRSAGVADVYNIRGGIQEWNAVGLGVCPANLLGAQHWASSFPFRVSPGYEQWATVITGFCVKPVYMLSALVIAAVLLRRRESDLAALRWAMIAFFLGELFCFLNYAIYSERSYLFEYFHGFGMALTFGLTAYALVEGMDLRLIHYSDDKAKCAAVALCQGCIKHSDAPCGLRRMFILALPVLTILSAFPLFGPFRMEVYNTHIFTTLYTFVHPVIHQLYEVRLLPILAMLLFLASLLVLLIRERHPVRYAKILFAAGAGAMGFSYFRLILAGLFAQNQVWFNFWEETTELIYILSAGAILFIFRHGLFRPAPPVPSPASPHA